MLSFRMHSGIPVFVFLCVGLKWISLRAVCIPMLFSTNAHGLWKGVSLVSDLGGHIGCVVNWAQSVHLGRVLLAMSFWWRHVHSLSSGLTCLWHRVSAEGLFGQVPAYHLWIWQWYKRDGGFLTNLVFLASLLPQRWSGRETGTSVRVCFCSSLRLFLPLKHHGFRKCVLRTDPIPVGTLEFPKRASWANEYCLVQRGVPCACGLSQAHLLKRETGTLGDLTSQVWWLLMVWVKGWVSGDQRVGKAFLKEIGPAFAL